MSAVSILTIGSPEDPTFYNFFSTDDLSLLLKQL